MVDDLRNVFQHPFAFIGQEEEEEGFEDAVPAEPRRAVGEENEDDEDEDEGEFCVESDTTETGVPGGGDDVEDEDDDGDVDRNEDGEDGEDIEDDGN